MSLAKVNSALITAYQAVALGLPTAYEDQAFTPPNASPWVDVKNLIADLTGVTLGSQGEDECVGVLGVDVYQPLDSGVAPHLAIADQLRAAFTAGRTLTYDDQVVYIRRTVPSTIRYSERYAANVQTVSVYWAARFQRNAS